MREYVLLYVLIAMFFGFIGFHTGRDTYQPETVTDTLYRTVYRASSCPTIYDTFMVVLKPQVGIITDVKVYYINAKSNERDSMIIDNINPKDSRR